MHRLRINSIVLEAYGYLNNHIILSSDLTSQSQSVTVSVSDVTHSLESKVVCSKALAPNQLSLRQCARSYSCCSMIEAKLFVVFDKHISP